MNDTRGYRELTSTTTLRRFSARFRPMRPGRSGSTRRERRRETDGWLGNKEGKKDEREDGESKGRGVSRINIAYRTRHGGGCAGRPPNPRYEIIASGRGSAWQIVRHNWNPSGKHGIGRAPINLSRCALLPRFPSSKKNARLRLPVSVARKKFCLTHGTEEPRLRDL